jgi:hypothetical protein
MFAKLKLVTLALLLSLATSCCAPKELFSCIDRHCFVADWMNEHSCVNRACYCGHNCSHGDQSDCTVCRPVLTAPITKPDGVITQ